jgi:predicted dinucleotide-binding enzyme
VVGLELDRNDEKGILEVKYAIIGSGSIGSALASRFASRDVQVGVATSSGVDALAPLVERIGPQIIPTEVSDALKADVVVFAVPFEAMQGLVQQVADWDGRIIIDATNAIDYKDFSPADLGGRASSDLVEEWAVNARVVKSFGTTWAKILAREPGDGCGGRRVMFLSGNHTDANAEISRLIGQLGFEPIDLGRNDRGGLLQQFGGPLTSHSFISQPIAGGSPPEMDLAEMP